jgi:hypothetical protein
MASKRAVVRCFVKLGTGKAHHERRSFLGQHTKYLAALTASLLCSAVGGQAATDVLANNYDNLRTGANLNESILNVLS